jgi:hypothetical protein
VGALSSMVLQRGPAMLDVAMPLIIGPLVAVAIASVWVYRDARGEDV